MIVFPESTQVGDFVEGVTVTEVRDDGVVFGVQGTLEADVIEELKQPCDGFRFRPGTRVGELQVAS